MAEPAQRKRPKRPTAIDMMGDSADRIDERTRLTGGNPTGLLPFQSTDQILHGSPNHLQKELWTPCETDGVPSSISTMLDTARSGSIDEDMGNRTADGARTSSESSQGPTPTHRYEARAYMQAQRMPFDRECHAPIYQGSPHNTMRGHPAEILTSILPVASKDRRQHNCWDGSNELLSRPVHQYPAASATSQHRLCYHAHQQPAVSATIEPHLGASYLGFMGHNSTAPFYQASNSSAQNVHGRGLQTDQAPQLSRKTNHPLLSAGSRPEFAPVHLGHAFEMISHPQFQDAVKYQKLCNNYHLRGACILGDSCRYTHGTIDPARLRELQRIAKGVVCKYGLECSDELCYAGHKCPYNPCDGNKCAFPQEMHYDGPEDTRGRAVNQTGRQPEVYSHNFYPRYIYDDMRQSFETGQRELIRREMRPPMLQHHEPAAPPPIQRYQTDGKTIEREVEELLDDVATRTTSQHGLPEGMLPPSCETTQSELDLFEEGLAKSYQGSLAGSPPDRCLGNDSYISNARSRANSHEDSSSKHGNRKTSNASSHGYDRSQRRNFRIGKTDSWRPKADSWRPRASSWRPEDGSWRRQ